MGAPRVESFMLCHRNPKWHPLQDGSFVRCHRSARLSASASFQDHDSLRSTWTSNDPIQPTEDQEDPNQRESMRALSLKVVTRLCEQAAALEF